MKVLIACEFSGTVREAFRANGHDAWSCDLLPTEIPGQHIKDDVLNVIDQGWELMIAHPPCTYLSSSGIHWNARRPGRALLTEEAIQFVDSLINAPIPMIAIENPVGVLSTRIRKPDQVIQPWQFGHPESKATCLWLKNLPLLKPTNVLTKPSSEVWNNQTPSGRNKLGPSPNRWKLRSITYSGIASAMADQWGSGSEPVSFSADTDKEGLCSLCHQQYKYCLCPGDDPTKVECHEIDNVLYGRQKRFAF